MKKYIIAFSIFCILFILALIGISTFASPGRTVEAIKPVSEKGFVENLYGSYNGDILLNTFTGTGQFDFLTGEKYVGTWEDCVMKGNGIIEFPGVGNYSGEFVNSQRSGDGSFTWLNGDKYSGQWKDDKMSGEGGFTFSNGCGFAGTFSENKIITGKLHYKNNLAEKNSETIK